MLSFILIYTITICGCDTENDFDSSKFNSEIYDNVNAKIEKDYLLTHRIKQIYYLNSNYIEGVSNPHEQYILDSNNDSLPYDYTIVIDDKQQYESIFIDDSYIIDFDKKVLVLYSFADIYLRNFFIGNIEEKADNINITLKRKSSNLNDCVEAYQRYVLVIMDKKTINNFIVEFED